MGLDGWGVVLGHDIINFNANSLVQIHDDMYLTDYDSPSVHKLCAVAI